MSERKMNQNENESEHPLLQYNNDNNDEENISWRDRARAKLNETKNMKKLKPVPPSKPKSVVAPSLNKLKNTMAKCRTERVNQNQKKQKRKYEKKKNIDRKISVKSIHKHQIINNKSPLSKKEIKVDNNNNNNNNNNNMNLPPLEMFDSLDEVDPFVPLPQPSLKAHSPYFIDGIWKWLPCEVLSYSNENQRFEVKFDHAPDTIKYVKRLNLRFDDEDADEFQNRREQCHKRREQEMERRRYEALIIAQPDELVAPMQKERLKGIVSLLDINDQQRDLLDNLLSEVKHNYVRSMKKSSIDADYQNLPPNALLDFQPTSIIPSRKQLSHLHWTSITSTADVLLDLFNSTCTHLYSSELIITNENELNLPLTLYEFQDIQDENTAYMRDKIIAEWRSSTINNIRDRLASVFNLFATDSHQYDGTRFQHFVKVTGLMMRTQLCDIIEKSINNFIEFMKGYSNLDDESRQNRSLFKFKIATREGRVTFLPSLDMIEISLCNIIDFPKKLLNVADIDSEVAPLMGFPEISMIRPESTPHIYKKLDEANKIIKEIINDNLEGPKKLAELYQKAQEKIVAEQSLKHLEDVIKQIETTSPSEVRYCLLTVDCNRVKSELIQKAKELQQQLLNEMSISARQQNDIIRQQYNEMVNSTKVIPNNARELHELKETVKNIVEKGIPELQESIRNMQEKMYILEEFLYAVSVEDFNLSWEVVQFPRLLFEALKDTRKRINEDSIKFKNDLQQERHQLQKDLILYREEVQVFVHYGSGTESEMEEYANQVEVLRKKLNEAQDKVASFNERDELFGEQKKAYKDLDDLCKEFEPYYQLWHTTALFQSNYIRWMTGPFSDLDYSQIDNDIDKWFKLIRKLESSLPVEPARVASEMKEKILEFKHYLPIIQWLRTPGLHERHWNQIGKLLNYDFKNTYFTLSQLLKLPIDKCADKLEHICNSAEKEYALEIALENMRSEWKNIMMEIVPYKETGTYIVKSSEDIIVLLDDQIMKTQAMRGSPYITPFEQETKQWESRLQTMSQIMEEWLMFQKTWLYLEPIFGSDDIMRQMPQEGRRFAVVDQYWKRTMDNAHKNSNALDFLDTDSLLKGFKECNKMLDLISKGLNDYLETKRLAFPRFYFLSNDELLNILSQTKDPTAVQEHLNKCFDAIHRLDFDKNQIITAMNSIEGEKVVFVENIDPNAGAKKGNVEIWLKDVERIMRDSLKDVTIKARNDYQKQKRTKWVLNQPGQVVLCVSQAEWTTSVTLALKENGLIGLKKYAKKLDQQLNELVELVRGELSTLTRITLGALTTIDVHARDVVNNMIELKVSDVNNFEWMKQLRYYWNDDDTLNVKMIQTSLNYGYEYLGNSSRLVITPLTDRAYATLMGAVHLHLGGAPEGPAGTGKTETVKDLAKALAIQCVVFNCSDGLDYLAMGKFFKGLASSGAWSCFDEFNRIQLEVLSVISQQISTIQRAIVEEKNSFFFENVQIPLIPTCSVFITMNPGYAGRSELPDNLKALFRTVAMMIPDYALIAEIILYSYGYNNARALAQKIVSCLRLASEQLSSQDHYDFGMRNVKAILSAAGYLKQLDINKSEELLCLEAINQCNLPKFTSADVPLFKGITQDLFPEANIERNISKLQESIKLKCIENNIQPTTNFLTKCTELYETICVRHGLMLVGNTFSAKSTCIKILAKALNNVKIQYINPKSVTRGQLYGQFDINTHEWTDGVLPPCIRNSVSDTNHNNKHWIVFDGPVDALWIEDMNTVLDDNKKLCLASGEIIKINNLMNFIFEVGDLSVASPATVSRCGMVYLEPNQLGWEAPVNSWLNDKHPDHREILKELFQWQIRPILEFINEHTKPMIKLNNLTLVNNICRMLQCVLKKDYDKIDLECQFTFAVIWSIGCTLNSNDRLIFSKFMKTLLNGQANEWNIYSMEYNGRELSLQFPENGLIYDYVFNDEHREWYLWTSIAKKYEIPQNIKPHEIVIPTIDSIRHSWLLKKLWHHNYHVILTGSTGTGKSLTIKETLFSLDTEKYVTVMMSFSARTNANQTQDIIDNKLERRRQGILGPPLYKKCMIFIDDLNMPSKEKYGAQPPLELLRQWMNYGGWYDRQTNSFKKLVDIQFVGAMMNNNVLPSRLLRHFHHIGVTPYDADSLRSIFGSIMNWYMTSSMPQLSNMCNMLVESTIDMYTTIVKELLPTPKKSHYTFNLRDISKVFQSIINVDASTINDKSALIRLWLHEMQRTFSDRLIDDNDQQWFEENLKLCSKKYFNVFDSSTLCFSNLMNEKYSEVKDNQSYKEHMLTALNDYNDANRVQMNLVLFPEAIEHVTRIARIISQPYGHALLVGVGGSGKQSLTRLASHMTNYSIYEINVHNNYTFTDWREDLKIVMRQTGLKNRKTVLLLSDTQMRNNNQFEDLNNILNNGEVPSLFAPDELIQLLDELKPLARKVGQANSFSSIYSFFVDNCKEHIHVVLCLSPLHPQFRTRLRQFPSLVNCCTIDWFQPWSNNALVSVAKRLLPEQKDDVINTCALMQTQVIELCEEYGERMGRHSYVTSKSYLEMLSLFKHLLNTVGVRTTTLKLKYENGLTKLEETEKQVVDMQATLEKLQPQLIQSTKEAVELMGSIEKQSEEVEKTREIVSSEEKDCNEQALVAQGIRDDCEAQLAEAIPILESALKALRVIRKQDIVELKSMKAPPSGVILTVQALCIMLGVPPIREGQVGKRKDNYWEAGKRSFLRDTHFIANLENYDKNNIPPERIAAIRPLLKSNDFVPQKIAKSSKACEGFCKWVRAMEVYDRVAKMIKPKREALHAAENKLKEAEDQLNAKKSELATIQAKLDDLQAQFDEANKRKENLEAQVNECEQRLERAEKLIGGLSGEKERWREKAKKLKEDHVHIVSNVLVSAGIIAYLGVFTQEYRQKCIKLWCNSLNLNDAFKLNNILSSQIQLREWSIQGLPKDEFSYDNAVILEQSQRYSLLIDPQGQATRWLKRRYAEKQFQVLKASDNQFSRQIQNAVQFGLTILVEGIGEEIDSVLNPILLRQFTQDGRRKFVQLGGESIEFNNDFQMYLITKLSNPHYTPETATKVTLINFMITRQALEDQMLNIVVSQVDNELERQRGELIVQNAENQKQLSNIEDKILNLLNDSKGMILDDIELIATLQKSKTSSLSIEKRMSAAKKTEDRINKFRNEYQKVAKLSARLFFCVVNLAKVDSMYQFSLRWYIQLFLLAIDSADRHPKIKVHTNNIETTFVRLLYRNVCRSLFEEHKLLFSFMMTLTCFEDSIQSNEFRCLLSGVTTTTTSSSIDDTSIGPNWLPKNMYKEIKNLINDFDNNEDEWYKFFTSSDPINALYPGSDGQESEFHRLLILKILRPEKLMEGIQKYVGDLLGNEFVTPPPFNLELAFNDANQCSPLLFILSPGMDPSNDVYTLAQECGQGHLESISLGQGQGPIAEQAIREAVGKGTWVLLENCHLAISWLPTLERIVDELEPETTNPQFRLWLTSKPTEQFPSALLQDCIKMTNEPPRGVKANLLRSLSSFKEVPSNIMYRLLLFHALVVERKQFGSLGWNIAYDFTEGDLNISKAQINNSRVALEYLIGELNYGGRVTDFWDRRTLKYILKSCFDTENLLGYTSDNDLVSLKESIEHELPLNDHPSVFGMHQNAAITSAIESGKQLTDTLLQLQPRDRVQSSDNDLLMIIADIKNRLPSNFDINNAREKFPIEYSNSMNTVLVQELERYNRLLSKIRNTLARLKSALTGEIVMDTTLELMADFIVKGQIPQIWRTVSYPTRKKLISWFNDLINRIIMFEKWLEHGPPGVYWISGFFFPQGFLTGTLQNYARSKRIPIDEVVFSFEIMEHINPNAQGFEAPLEGCYIHGLYLQGGGFKNGELQEEISGEMYTKMPVIWLKPIHSSEKKVQHVYECPVYKTSARAGTLSTTGHSTNFILSIDLPMNRESNTEHWVRRGTALLTMLDV